MTILKSDTNFDGRYLKLDGSNANVSINIDSQNFTTTGVISGGNNSKFGTATEYWKFTNYNFGGADVALLTPTQSGMGAGFIQGGLALIPFAGDMATGLVLLDEGITGWNIFNDYGNLFGFGADTLYISHTSSPKLIHFGANNISLTGTLGAGAITGTSGAFTSATGLTLGTDITAPTVNIAGFMKLWSAGNNAFYTTFTTGTQTANATYTLPVAMATANSQALLSSTAGVMSWGTNFGANNIDTTGTISGTTIKSGTGGLGYKDLNSIYSTYIKKYSGTPYHTQDRNFYLNVNNADRYLNMGGDLIVTGTSTINQNVSTTGSPTFANITDSALTSGRIVLAGVGGLLGNNANLTYNGTTLSVNSITDTGLTITRIPYAGTGGLLIDSSVFTFTTATGLLNTTGITASGTGTFASVNIGGAGSFPLYITGTTDAYGRMVEIIKTSYDLSGANTQYAFEIGARGSTGGSRSLYALNFDARYTGSGAQTGSIIGVNGQIYNTGTGNSGTSAGLWGRLYLATNANATTYIGMWTSGYVVNGNTGEVGAYYGHKDEGFDAGTTGSATSAYTLYGASHQGDVQYAYGIRLQPQTVGTSLNIGIDLHGDCDCDTDNNCGSAIVFGAGQDATIGYDGTDLIINTALVGSGVLRFGTHTGLSTETLSGYITIKDFAGNIRKLAVIS